MSRRDRGRLADSKGAELLRQLKAELTPTPSRMTPTPPRHGQTANVEREMSAVRSVRSPYLTPDAQKAARPMKKKKANKDKKAKKNGITVIRARTAEERALYRSAMSSGKKVEASQQQPSTSKTTTDFGEAAFRQLAPLREQLEGFSADHRGPSDVPPEDADVISRRIRNGAESAAEIVDFHDGYFLGYDFGTSTTKVVARYPHGPVDEAFAIDVPPSIASAGQAHLFPTAVYWNRELDRFSLVPGEGYVRLDSFKSSLIHGRGLRICNSAVVMAHAAVAFVALHLAYCIGTALEENPDFKLASVNVGIPVAALDGQSTVALFDRVMRAATKLVAKAPALSCAEVKAAFEDDGEEVLPFTRHAELSGAIAGYCAATRHYLGGHMIIDCGSATLDIVTFDLNQATHRPTRIYAACVENLGADACALYMKAGRTPDECRQAARFEEHLVYRRTIKTNPSLFCYENGHYPYQIILIGGGIKSDVHAPLLTVLAGAFEKPFHHPIVAETLRYEPSCEAGRLILADGLARDPIDLKEVALPRELPELPRGPEMISKDQV